MLPAVADVHRRGRFVTLRVKRQDEASAWRSWMNDYGHKRSDLKQTRNAKLCWLRDLDQRGLVPKLAILEEAPKVELPYKSAPHPAEVRWIERLLTEGHQLTNHEKRLKEKQHNDQVAFNEAVALGRELFG